MKACRVRLGLFLQVLTATRSVKKVRYFQPLNHNQCRPGSEDPHRRHQKFKYKTNSNYFKFVFKFICKKEMQSSCPHSAPTALLKTAKNWNQEEENWWSRSRSLIHSLWSWIHEELRRIFPFQALLSRTGRRLSLQWMGSKFQSSDTTKNYWICWNQGVRMCLCAS